MKISTKSLTVFFGLVLVMSIALSSTAYAIKNGQQDEDAHPYVCYIATKTEASSPWFITGTGSLISPTVVLTAGHITDDTSDPIIEVWVSFATAATWPPGDNDDWLPVYEWHTHSNYSIRYDKGLPGWITHDVGILVLEGPVADVCEYASLPEVGLVDTLAMNQEVDLVGYGVQTQYHGGGPPFWWWIDIDHRYNATAQLIASDDVFSDEFMKITANPAKGKGGTCFGDSGGPILLAGMDTVLGVCSWGTNGNCAGIGYQQRIDIPEILSFINSFL